MEISFRYSYMLIYCYDRSCHSMRNLPDGHSYQNCWQEPALLFVSSSIKIQTLQISLSKLHLHNSSQHEQNWSHFSELESVGHPPRGGKLAFPFGNLFSHYHHGLTAHIWLLPRVGMSSLAMLLGASPKSLGIQSSACGLC